MAIPHFAIRDSKSVFEPELSWAGQRVIVMNSNNHLGLMNHPRVTEAAIDAVRRYGTGCAGSRFLNGTLAIHEELESELAAFLNKQAAIVFPTGFQANIGAISALVQKNDHVVVDELSHASVFDGGRLSLGLVHSFTHNDHRNLTRALEAGAGHNALVIVSGIYSLTGDIADLPSLSAVCRRYRAALMVDDSDALGILGARGGGTAEHFGIGDRIELISASCAMCLATIGGFLAADAVLIDYLRHHARPLIFSASLPPAQAATALAALQIVRDEPERRARLWRNAHYFRTGLRALGFDVGSDKTPMVAAYTGSEQQVLKVWRRLFDGGVAAEPLLHPTTPRGRGLLRLKCLAAHDLNHLDQALEIIARCVPSRADG